MKDYAREENGGSCVMASCVDERFLPECMLDGKDGTFWLTTGMFPQEFVLALESPVRVSKITMLSLNVKELCVEKCESEKPDNFEKVFDVELANRGDRLQTEVHTVSIKAKFLKFTLLSGHGEFATVNRVSVVGESLDGDDGGDEDRSDSRQGSSGPNTYSRPAPPAARSGPPQNVNPSVGTGSFGLGGGDGIERGGSASTGFAGDRNS